MRRTLTARAVLVTCLVAFVSVVVTALVAAPLAVRGATQAARKGLADQAQIAAVLIGQRTNPQVEAGLVRLLRANDIEVYFIRDGRLRTAGSVPARLITALGAGQEIHNQTAVINRRLVLVEGRPLANAPGNGVLLTEPAATGLGGLGLLRGLWWALLAGLAAGAPAAGRRVVPGADTLARLVGDLLALARLGAVDFRVTILPVDLVGLMSDAARAWVSRCQALRVEFPREPVPVATDPGRLRQVVDGLLDNALRVLPPGAPVVLAVRPADGSGLATVEVPDGGPGVAEEDLALVVQRGAVAERYRRGRP